MHLQVMSIPKKQQTKNKKIKKQKYQAAGPGDNDNFFSYGSQPQKEQQQPQQQQQERPPIPIMPSDLFQEMALSQLELLAHSLTHQGQDFSSKSKVESLALYLPQENQKTGQLEFTPAILYPDPNTERVFIAPDAGSGKAPSIPRTLTKLPGFAHANTLLPGYPMMASDATNPGVGIVEEVICDDSSSSIQNKPPALSVPLLSGSQTVGVLLVSPAAAPRGKKEEESGLFWTDFDRRQVSRAAQCLSMALSMEQEKNHLRVQNNAFKAGLSDSLHQVKNPLQALRTYGKILQQQIADRGEVGGTPHLLELAERLIVQSDRVVDLITPMDTLVENLNKKQPTSFALNPAKDDILSFDKKSPLVLWEEETTKPLPWENETLEFARENSTILDFAPTITKKSSETNDNNNNAVHFSFDKFGTKTVDTSTTKKAAAYSAPSSPRPTTTAGSSPSTTIVGDLLMEMIFIDDVLEPIFSGFQAIAQEKGIQFEVLDGNIELPGVMASPRSFQEAVSNALDNAFKYVLLPKPGSPFTRNPTPIVRISFFPNENPSGATLIVEDNGPGISSEDRQRIFERGFRSEGTSSVKGSGIGLDISQSLMQRMGGVLTVAEPGDFEDSLDGAVFKFTLFREPTIET